MEIVVRELKLRSDTSCVISRASEALCAHISIGSNRSWQRIGPDSYFRPHTFYFASPYLCSIFQCELSVPKVLGQILNISMYRAIMHSHRAIVSAMHGGHAAPALGGLASSARASPRPQVSLRASLPVPVAERPVASRPGVWPIWVRGVTVFFPGDFSLPCAGGSALQDHLPAVHQGPGLRA